MDCVSFKKDYAGYFYGTQSEILSLAEKNLLFQHWTENITSIKNVVFLWHQNASQILDNAGENMDAVRPFIFQIPISNFHMNQFSNSGQQQCIISSI